MRPFTLFAMLALTSLAGAQPKGWQVMKDKTGACQVAIPPDWHVNIHVPGMATAPDISDVILSAQPGKEVRPIPDGAQPIIGVDKMIENTPKRVFWAGKPASYPPSAPPMVPYHVTVPGKGGTCVAQISVKQGAPDTLVKQMANSLGPAK